MYLIATYTTKQMKPDDLFICLFSSFCFVVGVTCSFPSYSAILLANKLLKVNYKQVFPFQCEDLLSCFGQSDTLMLHPF